MLQNPRSLLMREFFGERSLLMTAPHHLEPRVGRLGGKPEAVAGDGQTLNSVPTQCHDHLAPAPVVNKLDRPVNVNAVNSR